MDKLTHQLIFDVKAAVRLGEIESLWVALDPLFNSPDIANNQPFPLAFVKNVLVPVGQAMVGPLIPPRAIAELGQAPNAAARAITAACLAQFHLNGAEIGEKELRVFGKDDRAEVRHALMLTLQQGDASHLVKLWSTADSPKLREIAEQL